MTKLLNINICFFLLFQSYVYNFDYRLTYEVTNNSKKQEKKYTISYLINEHDNSFFASEINSSTRLSEITFLDQKGIYWKNQVEIKDYKNSSITLGKEYSKQYSNPYKYQVDNYDFIELKDTLLNNKVHKRFLLKSNDTKREKKKKLGREIYVIDTTYNIKPMLTFSTAYEIWKLRKNIPNGLIVEKYFYNSKNKLVIKEKLKSSEKISLKFNLSL